jgi:hypothetical protein
MNGSRTPPRRGTVEYLVAVAKDWTRACFAGAQSSDFVLPAHRFEMGDAGVLAFRSGHAPERRCARWMACRGLPRPRCGRTAHS